MASPEGRTEDGFETQFGVDHLAHFQLFQLLKDTLLSSSTPAFQSRVIAVSSSAHNWGEVNFGDYDMKKTGYDKWKSYGQAKVTAARDAADTEGSLPQPTFAPASHLPCVRCGVARV